ncbi:SSI family serine proteinase inhibitor [Streptomyces europaeiscabiei]|uniref:SSI family serine proteinase inhibitor n=1 Tax=Streptomyces europaeiscabiei TaxID=146819 RepID=A0ABU4N733_9ACTN|nr:SSI family serine proteinase inhibitor [Streptomyces europaeiscabiei]MDX2763825.1 SSI family serine proteinase inhibitor [Streptomyces europaeiscabiei]MDX2773540.1 SSI family serine proteinase inhibitor [Streptomyces europaeiscabiei]MDX3542827.1 SSI family serine proteinase inhibitor [Streptomyces europaeiscabiei]MDX3550671.1 SSI family serine proteinase inhibitor [Streptomyces europaeiscabiei]MDX3664897.1 SSI family serine proteinase inhibitor [Streptomyces europaeiscabiei]
MTNPTRAVRAGLLSALALLTVAASAPVRAAAVQGDWLYVSLTRGDARSFDARGDTLSSDTRGTLLLCDPPQGHGRATQACAELRRTDGDITRIPHRNALCTEIYAPVRATAEGQWNGHQVAYEQTFANACVMTARTGSVFALSD